MNKILSLDCAERLEELIQKALLLSGCGGWGSAEPSDVA